MLMRWCAVAAAVVAYGFRHGLIVQKDERNILLHLHVVKPSSGAVVVVVL